MPRLRQIHGAGLLQQLVLPSPTSFFFLVGGASSWCLQAALGEVRVHSSVTPRGGEECREVDLEAPP